MDSEPQPPRCVFVTGPRGRSRWLEERIAEIHAQRADARCAVLLADEGLTRTERFAGSPASVAVKCLFMPCLCCPGAADLPGAIRRLAAATRAEWVFVELPALAAAGLLAEFDRKVGWPREVVVSLNREWAAARRAQTLSVFQSRLLELADRVVERPATRRAASAADAGGVATPTLSLL
jgi:hypothetical protein